ncbi:SGNH/GDSL hydrolase family protein [Streptomyces vinaceus]|uniref:SGNH/GDSL hydrolase family protein n=1 Tax=Streptomyces vinaceus TaxID=1960 RepID=UPI00368F0A17
MLSAAHRGPVGPLSAGPGTFGYIEPFLLPIRGVVEAGGGGVRIGEKEREEWRADLDPKIQVVRGLARKYGAHLLAADGMFAGLSSTTPNGPEHWAADAVHPTPAGHAALAEAWLRLVA